MQIVAFLQARMGSSRLPGKVLMPVLGRPMIEWQLERLKRSKFIGQTVILTSTSPGDDPLARFCEMHGLPYFRGSESDVLSRFYNAGIEFIKTSSPGEVIVIRLTGDCPLIDPMMIDEAIEQFIPQISTGCRYFGYGPDLPDGMDFELFTWGALEEAYKNAQDHFEKEHVTPFIWRNPERFGVQRLKKSGVTPGLRFSVDYPEDLILVERLLKWQLEQGSLKGVQEISDFLKEHPNLQKLNEDIVKNEGLIKSALNAFSFKVAVWISEDWDGTDGLLEWATSMGVKNWIIEKDKLNRFNSQLENLQSPNHKIWDSKDCLANWSLVSFKGKWQEKILKGQMNTADFFGYIFQVSNKNELINFLTYLCHFQYVK